MPALGPFSSIGQPATHTGPLDGITVLDFSHVIAGPFATFHLAALGARVIKVENPTQGDAMRGKPRAFTSLNHGKECITLDLKRADDLARAKELTRIADVMVDNMRPDVLERFGLGEAQARELNPQLIHCSISGYGRRGEWAARPAYDHVIQAMSGMTLLAGCDEDGPIKVGFPVIDFVAGMLAALAIVAAVRRRDLTGEGEAIDVSMLGAALQVMYSMTVEALATGEPPQRKGNAGYSGSPAADNFECRDGSLALAGNTPAQAIKLAEVLGLTEQLLPLLAGQTRGFVGDQHAAEVKRLIAEAVRGESAAELEMRLSAAGVAAARVRHLGECVQEAIANGALEPWTLHAESEVQVPGLGFRARNMFGSAAR